MRNFKSNLYKIITAVFVSGFLVFAFWQFDFTKQIDGKEVIPEENEMTRAEKKAGRQEFFFNLTRDPATNSIPPNIRSRELKYAKSLQGLRSKSSSGMAPSQYAWQSVGPYDLGGRTRAIGVDQRNKDIIITGGASGGIWKSTDGGSTWTMKSDLSQNMSVSHLSQDPNNPDTWYYTSGEYRGNSASARGGAPYRGTGIYKSTDNGETWSVIPSTEDTDTSFNSRFDYTSRVKVSPATGSIFVASNAFGLLRSTDGGTTFPMLRGGINHHSWTDFDIDNNGNIIAIFSSTGSNASAVPGIFYSTDDGDSWTDVTPTGFPTHDRSVITFAPSNPDIAYVFTQKDGSTTNQGVAFFKLDITDPQNPGSEDRSANLPNFGDPVGGVNTQSSYNMAIAVKPDDENFVMIGGTNLFKSTDGFATDPAGGYDNADTAQKDSIWIGGYGKPNNVSQYPNQHPDQHIIAFDPTNPNRVWSGHDGAISVTDDITASPVTWTDKDNGLITSQFYTAAIGPNEGDDRVMGGAQDNGTPYFRVDGTGTQTLGQTDISSGDGTYTHFGNNYGYVSSQSGNVVRIGYDSSGNLGSLYEGTADTWAFVTPSGASNQLFVHPFEVDPTNDAIMYYPGGSIMWRNTELDEIPNGTSPSTSQGWDNFTAVDATHIITNLEVSRTDVLYYGASDPNPNNPDPPKVFRVDNASTSFSPVDISIPSAQSGAYLHDIAINPGNSDEAIVVLSNYNIVGIYHTNDGGDNWTAIEGSLEGDSSNPGPSIRNATIVPGNGGTIYLVGTSTGLYSTETLSGASTQWTQEASASIGFGVVEFLDARTADGDVVVGTHGLGIFRGDFQGTLGSPGPPAIPDNVVVDSDDSQVELDWTNNADLDLAEYRIYKGSAPDNLTLFQTISTSSYTDSDASTDPIYYQITAVDDDGNESGFSDVAVAYRGEKQLTDSWQLISSPLGDNNNIGLPNNFQLVGFSNGAYQAGSQFDVGLGFWIKPSQASSINFDVSTEGGLASNTVSLSKGWNLIGGVSDTTAVADIKDPSGILTNPVNVQEYSSGSYATATDIKPANGYFILAEEAGNITIEVDTTSGAPKNSDVEQQITSNFDKLIFRKKDASQPIFITNSSLGGTKSAYLMPPRAPKTVLDVRTSSGHRIIEKSLTDLKITSSSYPVQVQLSSDAKGSYRLIGTDEGEEVHFYLEPGKSVALNKAYGRLQLKKLGGTQKELTNNLSPNYPNPFNPSTTIKYQLAQQSKVSLEVYNVLGKKVRTLVNQVRQPGIYTERFDASRLSSGTYFVRIKAGTFTQIQKMTLIK